MALTAVISLCRASSPSEIITETSNNLNRQQAETEQVATAMNEMVATVQEVGRNVKDAAQSADSANLETENGKQIVTSSINEINGLASEIEHAGSQKDSRQNDAIVKPKFSAAEHRLQITPQRSEMQHEIDAGEVHKDSDDPFNVIGLEAGY